MDEVLSVFSVEAREQLEAMEAGLMQIEQGDHDAETLNAVFRAAHTIKGGAGVVEIHAVEQLVAPLARADRAGRFKQAIRQGGFAVVDMRNNRKVPNPLLILHRVYIE